MRAVRRAWRVRSLPVGARVLDARLGPRVWGETQQVSAAVDGAGLELGAGTGPKQTAAEERREMGRSERGREEGRWGGGRERMRGEEEERGREEIGRAHV